MVGGSETVGGTSFDARKCAAASGGRYGVEGKPWVSVAGYQTWTMISRRPWPGDVGSTRVGSTRCNRTVPARRSPVGASRRVVGPLGVAGAVAAGAVAA